MRGHFWNFSSTPISYALATDRYCLLVFLAFVSKIWAKQLSKVVAYWLFFVIIVCTSTYCVKVHIFWEGHTILGNLHHRFDRYYIRQIYGRDFGKFCGLLKIYELYFSGIWVPKIQRREGTVFYKAKNKDSKQRLWIRVPSFAPLCTYLVQLSGRTFAWLLSALVRSWDRWWLFIRASDTLWVTTAYVHCTYYWKAK